MLQSRCRPHSLCGSRYLRSSVPWLDMWGPNPWLRILGAIRHLRGLNPWPRVLESTLQPTVPYGAPIGCTRWHHRERGNLSSTLLRMETKWFLNIWLSLLAMMWCWQPRGTSSWVIPFFATHFLNFSEHSLSKQWCFNLSAKSFILLTILWKAVIILPLVLFFINLQKI